MAVADDPPDFNAKCGELDCRVEPVRATWQLLDVSRDLRTLKLVYRIPPCHRGNGRVTVEDTASRIGITVEDEEVVAIDTPVPDVYCPPMVRSGLLRVRLQGPVAGRPVEGGPRIAGRLLNRTVRRGGRVVRLVPRVLDLAASDASTVLMQQGFEVRRTGRRSGRVIAQSTRAGRRAARNVVRITIGRRPPPAIPPLAITLSSHGSRIEAPIGNWCGRSPEERSPKGLLGCSRANFPGHPTKRSLPVRAGGLLDIETQRAANDVFIRLSEGVSERGATRGRVGPDRKAHPYRGSSRRWRARLPSPLDPAGGVAVVVSYRYCATDRFACGHYYARVRPVSGRLSVR